MVELKTKPEIRFSGFAYLPAYRQTLGNWYIYVLLYDNGSLYKGHTNNLKRKINQHFSGHRAEHTKKHKAIKLVYFKERETKEIAVKQENILTADMVENG
ncbi:MAG: GIY-YIG nuclease family protein [Helicobacteraceae bacterium]|jgi:predicted GIY-YIG superfamily endonuclease|nr:GIY-YIG nuclease family protein [Helicobacteraceae bacterium]